MAAAKPVQLDPQAVDSDEVIAPEVSPLGAPVSGPVIEYVDEGAELVVFEVNPKATKYVVYSNGMIVESL